MKQSIFKKNNLLMLIFQEIIVKKKLIINLTKIKNLKIIYKN
jgi:hypothetical protein